MGEGVCADGRGGRGLKIWAALRSYLSRIADALIPLTCVGCGDMLLSKPGLGLLLCEACASSLVRISPPWCPQCGLPMPSEGLVCPDCSRLSPSYDICRAVFAYAGEARTLVLRVKHARAFEHAKAMGRLMAATAVKFCLADADLVMPVPATVRRILGRGYNQAALLAREVARSLQRPLDAKSLRRIRDPGPTKGLRAEERLKRARGCFDVRNPWVVQGRKILLVDDVMTTGATISACAEALKAKGAAFVGAIVFARALPGL